MNKSNLEQVPDMLDTFSKMVYFVCHVTDQSCDFIPQQEVISMTHNRIKGLYDIDPPNFPSLKVEDWNYH